MTQHASFSPMRFAVSSIGTLSSALAVASVFACASAPPVSTGSASTPEQPPAAESLQPSASRARPRERTEWRQHFEAEQVSGTIALFDSATGTLSCSDVERCGRAVLPASTFKIPNSLIALEIGVLEGPDSVIAWDGKPRAMPEWNEDLTLRTAVRVSCVPCFQWVARTIGHGRMKEWLDRLDYGNHELGGGIDQFWLSGALRITPVQQIEFLRRLDGEKLPIQARTLEIVRDIITLDVGQNHVFRGKTGWAMPPDVERDLGWFVGWVELEERRVFFATLLDARGPDVDFGKVRRRLTETILRAEGLLPA